MMDDKAGEVGWSQFKKALISHCGAGTLFDKQR